MIILIDKHSYLTKILFERKSARYYKEYISGIIRSQKPIPLPQYKDKSKLEKFNISAGSLFFKEYNKMEEIYTLISSLLDTDPDNVKLCMLNILYSPENLGYILILADDKNNPSQALEELNKISGGKKKKTAISKHPRVDRWYSIHCSPCWSISTRVRSAWNSWWIRCAMPRQNASG